MAKIKIIFDLKKEEDKTDFNLFYKSVSIASSLSEMHDYLRFRNKHDDTFESAVFDKFNEILDDNNIDINKIFD